MPWTALVAVVAVLLLVGGFAWSGLAAQAIQHKAVAADAAPSRAQASQAATLPHAVNGMRDSYADVVKVVAPAVVTIRTESKARMSPTQFQGDDLFRRFFGEEFGQQMPRQPREFRERALGSGVIVSSDGYILTNYHVIGNADEIKVDLHDGRTLNGKLIGSDKPSDLALVKINASDLHPLALGDSDRVQVGDVVLAVGNPLGIGQTVTMGIISAKNRTTGSVGPGGEQSYENFLQTDAPINHGNSGGPLVNTKGELIGINSQILSMSDGNIGIGFAIPANMARNVMNQLRTTGHVTRAQLGVTVQPVTSDMAKSLGLNGAEGAIVASVSPDSAAARAGIKQGDVIESFDGQPVHDTNGLRNRVADSKPGSQKSVKIWRNGSEQTLNVTLGEAQTGSAKASGESDSDDKAALGVAVEPLTPDLASRIGVARTTRGVVVDDVSPDGRAADAGIQQGDVIESVNRKPVTSVDDLREAVRSSADKPLLLLVNRRGNEVFVTVPTAR
ncbi:MAG: DegQ family serine endoprotease [Betaproteobacteria bacterium]